MDMGSGLVRMSPNESGSVLHLGASFGRVELAFLVCAQIALGRRCPTVINCIQPSEMSHQ